MSKRELDRLQVLVRVREHRLTQREAARILGVSDRQVRRMLAAYERGRPSNRKLAEPLRELAVSLVRTHYSDFGPTFAHEKLTEVHGLELSVSTLRTWMVEESLWVPRSQRHRRIHQRTDSWFGFTPPGSFAAPSIRRLLAGYELRKRASLWSDPGRYRVACQYGMMAVQSDEASRAGTLTTEEVRVDVSD